ncbi:NAD-dependent epimerase/dehydratase family protein [Pedobacter panaciterrae]
MHKILITGITGFLGSHIAEKLIQEGIGVIGLKRTISDTWRCNQILDKIEWVDIETGYQDLILKKQPDTIIHSAWIGVEAKDRDNWTLQAQNIQFLVQLLEIAKQTKVKKIIFLGSQSEYGITDGKVFENKKSVAATAYGSIKLACLEILKTFSETNHIDWVWLRVFSLFGERENVSWLIPSLIKRMTSETEMDFTKGEQMYAYLYVRDFAEIILRIVNTPVISDIYNVSANEARSLKSVITEIRDLVNPKFKLNMGVLPYRKNQSMHIEGDISKLQSQIGEINFTNFNVALRRTLKSYLSQSETE